LYIFYQTLPFFHFDLEKNETLVHFSIKAQSKSCYALPSFSQCEFEFHRKTGFSFQFTRSIKELKFNVKDNLMLFVNLTFCHEGVHFEKDYCLENKSSTNVQAFKKI